MREKVKALWRLCFNDSEEFVDLYFRLRYSNEVNIALQSGEEVIAALQMLPYPLAFGGKEIPTAYVSGACTHPDYRNRGVMRELLSQAFARMWHEGVVLSTLIPAEPWLFDYYARSGYAPLFRYEKRVFKAGEERQASGSPEVNGLLLHSTDRYEEKAFKYLDWKLRERSCCVLHPKKDFEVVLADLRLSGGKVYTLRTADRIAALAIATPVEEGGWVVNEWLSDTSETGNILLQGICRELHLPSIGLLLPPLQPGGGLPLGMARIVNALAMLQGYAAAHPEQEMDIALTDEQISANNGYYYLHNGRCMKSAKRLPGSHLALTVGELAEKLLASSCPYMSLMLN